MKYRRNVLSAAALFLSASTSLFAEVLTVDQGWSDADRSFFYFSPQGSPILPLEFFQALEQPQSDKMFFDKNYLKQTGMIFWDDIKANPLGLPIGLTVDKSRLGDEPYLGMNCAACHVTEIKVKDKTALVDGGVSHFDFWAFMSNLNDALQATYTDDAKFDRFAARIENNGGLTKDPDHIRASLRQVMRTGQDWAYRNHTTVAPGPGRVDALNVILNQVTSMMLDMPQNARAPDAPVSYPFLWDAPYLDFVQYNGVVPNQGAGALARNVGQVLGVFGQVDLAPSTVPLGYSSSVNVPHLMDLEQKLETLTSPAWVDFVAKDLLPALDQTLLAQGALVYDAQCASCHAVIDRQNRGELASIPVKTFALSEIATDPNAALGFAAREVVTGPLNGRKVGVVTGDSFCEVTHGNAVLAHVDAGVMLHNLSSDKQIIEKAAKSLIESSVHSRLTHLSSQIRSALGFADTSDQMPDYSEIISSLRQNGMTQNQIVEILEQSSSDKSALFDELVKDHFAYQGSDQTCMEVLQTAQYRSRPLNGVWATGPFLHNGSVPTLADLLKKPAERPATFLVGDGNFMPETVGFSDSNGAQGFVFDTRRPGNSNQGHNYGTDLSDADKIALMEYLKGL